MTPNKYKPHIIVLPEDRANSEIANGFLLNPDINERAIQVLPYAGGWPKVLKAFTEVHIFEMQKIPNRMMVLLVDFDDKQDRLNDFKKQIPDDLKERVFVLGVQSEPEDLAKGIKRKAEGLSENKREEIGEDLAKDCVDSTNKLWGHELLKHNRVELNRMSNLKMCLFS